MRMLGWIALAGALAAAAPAMADVIDAQPYGFKVESKAEVAAPPAKVWAALGDIGRWWSPMHTWSHDAGNLSLELKVGGCFCEALPNGGGVRHLEVVEVKPGEMLVLNGAMGPMLFSATGGRMIWSLAAGADGHTTVTETFYAGGYYPGGLDKLAPIVDRVFAEQLQRLKAYMETGKPAP